MSSKTNQLPKGRKAQAALSPKRHALPFYLAGGALLMIIVGLVLLVSPGRQSSGASSPAPGTDGPRLAVDRDLIDFGKVQLGKTVKATFVLSNIGDQLLTLQGVPVVELKKGC